MHTEALTELELFYRFLENRLQNGGRDLTLDESIQAFRQYQRDLARLQKDLETALDESARGESQALDVEDTVLRGRQRASEKGLTG